MSGQQIGTAVGFVAGFFLPGGPQVWAAIGGFIGGVIDPTEIKGPHIGDGAQQSSNEGVPIALILGTAGWVQGNIVQISERREVKKEDDGKGGPVVVTYEAHQDFCIMAAESDELRGSTIVGVLMVRVNGKIVYDMRPEANMSAENAKFLQHHKFQYGAEDQMPDATMEAISGVGNTPAYRGVFTMIARDLNLTEYGGAIPTYEFVLVGEGEVVETTATSYVPPVYAGFADSDWPLTDPDSSYRFIGIRVPISGSAVAFEADTRAEIIQHFADDPATAYGGVPDVYVGYSAASPSAGTAGNPAGHGINRAVAQLSVVDNYSLVLAYQNSIPLDYINSSVVSGSTCALVPLQSNTDQFYADKDGVSFGKFARTGGGSGPGPAGLIDYSDCSPGNIISGMPGLYISVFRRTEPPVNAPGDPCLLGYPTALPDTPGFVIDCDGIVTPAPVYTAIDNLGMLGLQAEATDIVSLRTVFTKYTVGPIIPNTSPDNNQAFWEAEYAKAVAAGTVEPGGVWPTDYPVTTQFVYRADITTSALTSQELSVASAIERLCERGGLEAGDVDTSEITANLRGYPIQADYNAADCIKPLLAYCSSFGSEYDGQLHFHPYGGAIEITIDPQDFIEGTDVTDDGSREQAKEYPRKLSVNYVDIEQNYTVRPQYAYRTTPDVRAIGEETIQIPVCDTGDHASKIAEIAMKVSYARLQGTRKFSVPYVGYDTYLKAVAGMPVALDGKRWVANKVTLEDGLISFELAYDRQSAYTSVATGVPAPPPTPPVSTVGGVTLVAIMNLPALQDQDDRLGLYFAVGGILSGWPGCDLQISRDDEASWQTAISSMTQASVIGYLTAPLADAYEYGDDVTNTLSVAVHGGQLDSITQTQYLNEQNPCAIVKPSGQAEIIQFRDANETSADHYDLTYLARGRLGTTTDEHPAKTRFCSLNDVYFLELLGSDIGRTLKFRAVTRGTTPDSNAVYSIVFNPAISQTEYPPTNFRYELVGTTLTLQVSPRHRFGTGRNPIRSTNFEGFHWDASDGVNSAHSETTSPETSIDVTGWSGPITVEVRQVNRITGAGPALVKII